MPVESDKVKNMRNKILLAIFLLFLCIDWGSAENYDPNDINFDYAPSLVNYKIIGAKQIWTGQDWSCNFVWHGGSGRPIVIASDKPMPIGMRFLKDLNDVPRYIAWHPDANDTGMYYINLFLGERFEPNDIRISDRGTLIIKVNEWANPPKWRPMCGG